MSKTKLALVIVLLVLILVLLVKNGARNPSQKEIGGDVADTSVEDKSSLGALAELAGVDDLSPELIDGEYVMSGPLSWIKWNASPYFGEITDKEVKLKIEKGKPAGGSYVKLNIGSLEVYNENLSEDEIKKLKKFIKSPVFANIAKGAIAEFNLKSSKSGKDGQYVLGGDVKVAGKTYPKSVKATIGQKDNMLYMMGEVKLTPEMFAEGDDYKKSEYVAAIENAKLNFYMEFGRKADEE